jgi:hypothetical protein
MMTRPIAYEVGPTKPEWLKQFVNNIIGIGAIPRLLPVNPNSTCDCVTQALWLRNLAYHHPEMAEDDLMMISESDVLITTGDIIKPLLGDFRAWIYWSEPALYGGRQMLYWLRVHYLRVSYKCKLGFTKHEDTFKDKGHSYLAQHIKYSSQERA